LRRAFGEAVRGDEGTELRDAVVAAAAVVVYADMTGTVIGLYPLPDNGPALPTLLLRVRAR
jgi:hypothetical protein